MVKKRIEKKNERFFIDLNAKSNATGGVFVKCKALKDKVKEIEEDKTKRVVGVVYDGTDNLEIVITKIKQ
tara:strand:+ start:1562 stop:1771 length:210 start_codon:yes stop_codon:yes gene_type:complete